MAQAEGNWTRTIELHYTQPLVQQAAKVHWVSLYQSRITAVIAVVVLFLLYSIVFGSLATGLIVMALVVDALTFGCIYLCKGYCKESVESLRAMKTPVATFEINERGYRLASELGDSDLPWRSVVTLKRLRDVWVMLFQSGAYVTLPLDDLDDEAQSLLLTRVRTGGGKIA